MVRYACKIQYDGTGYVGYQIQPNGLSIQESIEKALGKMAKLPKGQVISIHASGRTDSGVHALGQVIHFDYPAKLLPKSMLRAMNSILDPSIRVIDVAEVSSEFHSRYHAVAKEYIYRVSIERFPDPFKRLYTLHHPYRCDIERIQTAIKSVIGTHDFTSFCSIHTEKENKVRTIYEADIRLDQKNKELIFRFYGNGFLYNMVRILVGTLLQIGDGLKETNELQRLLEVKERKQAGYTARPEGLYLNYVEYEINPFDND